MSTNPGGKSGGRPGPGPRTPNPAAGQQLWWLQPVWLGLLVLTVLALALFAALWGTQAAAPRLLRDPGAVVRWGLPTVRAVSLSAGILTVGALVLAALVVPRDGRAWRRCIAIGCGAGLGWVFAGLLHVVFVYADVVGRSLSDPALSNELGVFLTQVELTRRLLLHLGIAAVATTVAFGARSSIGAGAGLVLALLAWWPLALTGHTVGANHEVAVSAWWIHAVAMAVWVGGLVTLVLIRPLMQSETCVVALRFSGIALWCYALVGVSGLASAWVRLNDLGDLDTRYGWVVVAKTLAWILLGAAGWCHRGSLLSKLNRDSNRAAPAMFWRVVAAETLVMGAAMGLAVALGRSAPPVPDLAVNGAGAAVGQVSPAEQLTGRPLPPPPSLESFGSQYALDLFWALVSVAMLVLYLRGVWVLHRRGDRWPVLRTVCWVLGCLVLIYLTCGPLAVYGRVLFSLHMVQHMSLSMIVPALWVLGAPATLLFKAGRRRRDATMGAVEWVRFILETRWVRTVGHPVVAAVIFVGSLIAFYFSSAFELAVSTHTGHLLMTAHFLIAGYLFVQGVCGIDPSHPSHRVAYPLRIVLLFATMAFHAFFGVAVMTSTELMAPGWFPMLGWDHDSLADQQAGGEIAWGIGELPTLMLAVLVAVQWSRSDEREARRLDRQADRDHDAALNAYNAMLADAARRDKTD